MDWYGLIWFGLLWYGIVWVVLLVMRGGRGVMLGNVLEFSRLFLESPKCFMVLVGGGGTKQLLCLLMSRFPESEIEVELQRNWEASRVDLEKV